MIVTADKKLKTMALTTRKRLGLADELGEIIIGESKYGDNNHFNGIYQMRVTLRGKKSCRMNHYYPDNPQTEAQQTNRAKMATAVSDWQALTEEQKNNYRALSKYTHMTGFNLYIKTRLLSMV